jgi:surfactin synthase thioesterase subunit
VTFDRAGVAVHVVTGGNLRAYFTSQIEAFKPNIILTSTDDPAQLLLEAALRAPAARVVYLARATLAVPFGPDCAFPSQARTARIREADLVVGVSEYVARYIREHAGIPAVHAPISLIEQTGWPFLGRAENEFVTTVNPCAVKGISIFLALADAFPDTAFAAVPIWGTTEQDLSQLRARSNVTVLDPVDDVDLLFARTRVLLVPSLWAEARSRIVLEAMLRGIPVIASATGGIPEAKMDVPYVLPINPIVHYQSRVDDQMVPVADVPAQDLGPWHDALARLLQDRVHYSEIAQASRKAALDFAGKLTVEPFERLLIQTPRVHATASATLSGSESISPDKRRLLSVRLRKKSPSAAWFPGADNAPGARLFWFPHAGGGTHTGQASRLPRGYQACPVRLPGRESRLSEAPFERMAPLVDALRAAIQPYLGQPFAFLGHSMGAIVAFELARELRRRSMPLPVLLIASAARAPQFRRNHTPPPPPGDEQFLAELRQLEGIPDAILEDPAVMRALLPALKADAALYRSYIYSEDEPLPFPICAYGGTKDPNIRADHLDPWSEQTTAGFMVRRFPGGHFYWQQYPAEFYLALEADLK